MGAGTQDGNERRGTSSPFLPGLRTEGASEGTQHTCLTSTTPGASTPGMGEVRCENRINLSPRKEGNPCLGKALCKRGENSVLVPFLAQSFVVNESPNSSDNGKKRLKFLMLSAELGMQQAVKNLWREAGTYIDRWGGGLPPAGGSDSPGPGSSCVWCWPLSRRPHGQSGCMGPGPPPAGPWGVRLPRRTLGCGCRGVPPALEVEAMCAGGWCPGRHGGRRLCGRGPGRKCPQKIPEPPGWPQRRGPGRSHSR